MATPVRMRQLIFRIIYMPVWHIFCLCTNTKLLVPLASVRFFEFSGQIWSLDLIRMQALHSNEITTHQRRDEMRKNKKQKQK